MLLRRCTSAAAAVAAAAGSASLCLGGAASCDPPPGRPTLLDDASLNQPAGVPQSLKNWRAVWEDGNHFVTRIVTPPSVFRSFKAAILGGGGGEEHERHRCPDGGNFVQGVPHPPFISSPSWDGLHRTAMAGELQRPGDVWVATYPKCGTTFTEQIILLLQNDGDPSLLHPASQNTYNHETGVGKIWVEQWVRLPEDAAASPTVTLKSGVRKVIPLKDFGNMPAPRLLKTHAPRHMFLGVAPVRQLLVSSPSFAATGRAAAISPGTKVVYTCRNPKDACVSAYYHAANPQQLGIPFDAWAYIWLAGLFEHGRWTDHLAGWRAEALSNPEQVLFVRYEALKEDPEMEIRRIASFLEIAVTDELVARTVTHSGFAAMKKQSNNFRFFRKGVVGDYAKHFSPGLAAEFDAEIAEQMRGVDDPYRGTPLATAKP